MDDRLMGVDEAALTQVMGREPCARMPTQTETWLLWPTVGNTAVGCSFIGAMYGLGVVMRNGKSVAYYVGEW